jgi:sodium-dependent dicarboxylate transporter 2/3/5
MNEKIKLVNPSFLLIGLVLFFIPDFFFYIDDLDYNARLTLKMMILMIFFWLTEAIPTSVTALIPIILSPFYLDLTLKQIIMPYASPVVFLLLGGFIIALGFEKSNLHQRVALKTIITFGNTKKNLLYSFVFSTSFFSMWLSNTATCLLMIPIVKYIIDCNFNAKRDQLYSKFLLLSVAYAASIGGMSTPIGTIPNAILVGFLDDNHNIQIDFFSWVIAIIPLVLLLLFCLCFFFSYKTKNLNEKINLENIFDKYKKLGKFSYEEKIATFILFFTACLWVFKSSINSFLEIKFTDSSIAILGAFLFFVFPSKNKNNESILNFSWFKKVPWNILILFGGGLTLASLVVSTGLANKLSTFLNFLGDLNIFFIILIMAFFISILTEFTSNTATTFLLLPIFGSFAVNNDFNIIQIMLPGVLAASCAFMMPISTPPNAIVYSTNKIKISFMISTGFLLNFISVLLISIYIYFLGKFNFISFNL